MFPPYDGDQRRGAPCAVAFHDSLVVIPIPGGKFEAHVPPGALRGKTPAGKSEAHVPPGALRGKLGGLSSFILEILARAEAWHATRTCKAARSLLRPLVRKTFFSVFCVPHYISFTSSRFKGVRADPSGKMYHLFE